MDIKKRLNREKEMHPVIRAGYTRKMAAAWYRKTQRDAKVFKDVYTPEEIERIHDSGYLCGSVEKYGLQKDCQSKYITDFDYLHLSPFNNSFSKWVGDILTTTRVLKDFPEHNKKVYFTIVQRNGGQLILKVDDENREYTVDDVEALIREKGAIELRSAYWLSKRRRYRLECVDDQICVNGKPCIEGGLAALINSLNANHVITDITDLHYEFSEQLAADATVKLWIANDAGPAPQILCAVVNLFEGEGEERQHTPLLLDLESGTFTVDGREETVHNWDEIKAGVCAMAGAMRQLTFFTTSVSLGNGEPFRFLHFSAIPALPQIAFNDELNDYLKAKSGDKKDKMDVSLSERAAAIKKSTFNRYVKKHVRKGMRPYMYQLWLDAVKSDLVNTKGVSLSDKVWAWKHGFQSFRIKQYGLTKDNYKEFLSDFDYYWLNRINNSYQIWVNDKTTFRYIMEPFKEYVPAYYFSLFKRNGKVEVEKMWDCPDDVENGMDGLYEMLRRKGKLALKPSAGTHGDGFYCLAYEDGFYTANGQTMTREEMEALIDGFHSYYVATEYIDMHDEIKKIYAKSVNSVRVMVINEHGYDPQIMQSYMRIGSSRTGYTDNVGYGGICVMVNKETGELYKPETIKDHEFSDCPTHPDTGTPIAGVIPNWELICTKIKEICRYLCELEYLGFDIAVTNDGFRVIEINIHQDLHKVPTFSDEVKTFFQQKISNKLGDKQENKEKELWWKEYETGNSERHQEG